jgi:hypothetical protein
VRRGAVEEGERRGIRCVSDRAPVARCNDERTAAGDHTAHGGLAEHESRALLGVVGIDRHVGRTGRHRSEDREVELARSRRHADADPVAAPHTGSAQSRCRAHDARHQLPVAECAVGVLDRRGVGMPARRLAQHVDQRSRRRRERGAIEDSGGVSGHVTSCSRRMPGERVRGQRPAPPSFSRRGRRPVAPS